MVFFIVPIVLLIIFYLVYQFYFKKNYGAQYQQEVTIQYAEISQELESYRSNPSKKLLAEKNKLQPIQEALGGQKITGITSCIELHGTTDFLKGMVSANPVIIMDNFYLATTDTELHYLDYNGYQLVEHLVFTFSNIQNAQVKQLSAFDKKKFEAFNKSIAANMAGNSEIWELKFDSDGKNYKFYFYTSITGYPHFDFDDATKLKTYHGESILNYKTIISPKKSNEVLLESELLPLVGKEFIEVITKATAI